MKTKTVKYKCKENDNHLRFFQKSGDETGEVWVSDALKKSWTIIGIKDMTKFLWKAGFFVSPRTYPEKEEVGY